MRQLSKSYRSLFRKRGECEEHGCPRPCYDCMWAAAFLLENSLKQTRSLFKSLVKDLGERAVRKKKDPRFLSDQELEIYRRSDGHRQNPACAHRRDEE